MKTGRIEIAYNGSRLYAIPSVHFNHVFAGEVNKICSDRESCPDVIAVELGPQSAATVRAWLKELGVMPGQRKELPVMLALTKKNRMIRASLREKAKRLQQDTGKDLSELPSDLLYEELGFADNALICLAPTDSIIEAIRCSLELNVPLYGVDLEETANCDYDGTTIEDPIEAQKDLAVYIEHNAIYPASRRDDEIDTRREIAMVGRLKAILHNHRRVVFVCGLAHWPLIREMLCDSSIRPSKWPIESPEYADGIFRRTVLHPVKAMQFMDKFPAVVKEYEKNRVPSDRRDIDRTNDATIDLKTIFCNLLNQTYKEYFVDHEHRGFYCHQDLESRSAFEDYLNNICLMNFRVTPDFFMAMSAAQEMMSRDFVRALTRTCMDFPWTTPDKHANCSLLAPGLDDDGSSTSVLLKNDETPWNEQRFYIRTVPGQDREIIRMQIPYEWRDNHEGEEKIWMSESVLHTWIPWEYLISSLSLRAIDKARRRGNLRRIERFEGSLMDGVDIKNTLRSYSRGKETVFVRTTTKEPLDHVSETIGYFPVVWLLNVNAPENQEWIPLYECCDWMAQHVRDRHALKQVQKLRGDKMIALTAYGSRYEQSKASEENPQIRSDRCHGITIYQPICWSRKQFARWAETTNYRRNPYCHHGLLDYQGGDLKRFFEKEHDVKVGEHHWTTSLILMALPFAKEFMAVVAPDEYMFDPLIRHRAQRYGVELYRVPLSSFTREEMEKLSINHMAPAILNEPRSLFDKSIEAALGEKQTDNEYLVPRSCLEFGMM